MRFLDKVHYKDTETLINLIPHMLYDKAEEARIVQELKLLDENGNSGYFVWIHKKGIKVENTLHSYVAWLIGITKDSWDGEEHKLNIKMVGDYPDIDMDFDKDRRDEVKQYLMETYGEDHVSSIGTYSTLSAKAVLKDVARVYGVNLGETQRVADLLIHRHGGDSRVNQCLEDSMQDFKECVAYAEKYPEVVKHGQRLEGANRHVSCHAAGVIISKFPLDDVLPLSRSSDGSYYTGYTGKENEKIGFLKLDVLGLKNLTVNENAVQLIWRRHGVDLRDHKLDEIALNDKPTLDNFAAGHTVGIFQFESDGMAKLSKAMAVDSFNDLIAANAIHRPGPLHSGFGAKYVENKRKIRQGLPIEEGKLMKVHPELEASLKPTMGLTLYQEQIMQIAFHLGKLTWSEAEEIRWIMSKSLGMEYLNKFRDKFAKGCTTSGLSMEEGREIFDSFTTFGNYAFNKSHACAYALVAYQGMYLKTHFPIEFMVSLLAHTENDDQVRKYIRECDRLGLSVKPPDINGSGKGFSIVDASGGSEIVFGLSDIKGVGVKASEAIIAAQPFTSYDDFVDRVSGRTVNIKVRKLLQKVGAFRRMNPEFTDSYTEEEVMQIQSDLLSFPIGKHPIEHYRHLLENSPLKRRIITMKQLLDDSVKPWSTHLVAGVVRNINWVRTGEEGRLTGLGGGQRWAKINFEDEDEYMMVNVPPLPLLTHCPELDGIEKVFYKGAPMLMLMQKRMNQRGGCYYFLNLKTYQSALETGDFSLCPFHEYFFEYPLKKYVEVRQKASIKSLAKLQQMKKGSCDVIGLISKIKIYEKRAGETMAFITLEDETCSNFEITIFPDDYGKWYGKLLTGCVIYASSVRVADRGAVFSPMTKVKLFERIKLIDREDCGIKALDTKYPSMKSK